jgi:outer membrane protein assembly factor BamD
LQTLISSYPDSEFVPEAKYAIAESWYQMGTRSDMVQADYEFSDYIIYFPITELADDAQMMRAMTHIRQMQKADRDPSESLLAERELQVLIDGYPDSDLLDEAKDKLRGVQDVLAEHYLKIGNHYFAAGANGAAATRYLQVLREYPDFEGLPEALYRLGELFLTAANDGEAIVYYARLIREHPFSTFDERARERLGDLDQPIPDASEAALAAREMAPEEDEYRSLGKRMLGVFSGRPDISTETTAASVLVDNPAAVQPGQGEFSVDGVVIDAGEPPGAP